MGIRGAYVPGSKKESEKVLWEDLSEYVGNFDERDQVLSMEDLNLRVGSEAV